MAERITLEQMLLAREARAEKQRQISKQGLPLLSFTMNMAGPVKNGPLVGFAFRYGLRRIRRMLPQPVCSTVLDAATGPEAMFVYRMEAKKLKQLAEDLETEAPVGRLFDLDVLDADGKKLSRAVPRRCMICAAPAVQCARSRAHGLGAVMEAQQRVLREFAADSLAAMARDALLTELRATPKPGLVDAANSGAHRDMDYQSFVRSAAALEPFFRHVALVGLNGRTRDAGELMKELQALGRQAEADMLLASGGANTHKGALYCMGLTLAAAGLTLAGSPDGLYGAVKRLASSGGDRPADTHGGEAFLRYGADGARGQAERGFPAARAALKVLSAYSCRMDRQEVAVLTLPHIMAELKDTNLLHRGGAAGLAYVQRSAERVLDLPEERQKEALCRMDACCIARDLSPGGAADVLSLALLLQRLEESMGTLE